MHPEAVLFAAAIVLAIAVRVIGRWRAPVTLPAPAVEMHVLLSAPAGSEWQACVWSLLTQAREPSRVRVNVLLECRLEEDTKEDVDTQLRGFATVSHVRTPDDARDACRRVRRLARHFLTDTDARVVVLGNHRVRLAAGWDARIAGVRLPDSPGAITVAACAHAVGFPTLEPDGRRVRRGAARAFPKDVGALAAAGGMTWEAGGVPVVCWCPELTVARARALRAWPRVSSCVALEVPLTTLTHPLVEPDADLEREMLACDDGVVRDTPARHARVGLCTRDDWEATLKFGSARAARLARAFTTK